jgi:hypothetical protein
MGARLAVHGMTARLQVHQLYHGYRRGHEQLASSTSLARADSEVVTRLSDLSGTLVSGLEFKSYLTMFPLPSSKFYAVAMTRPDVDAPRTGCVLTHTLLVDIDVWASLAAPQQLSVLFFKNAAVPQGQIQALDISSGSRSHHLLGVTPQALDFTARYFGEGTRPIVWLDAPNAEDLLWAITSGLWPSLRRLFSSCTFCLQPRFVADRMFHLMFAPGVARSRFSKLSDDHLVGSAPLASEPWLEALAKQIFGDAPGDPEDEFLMSELDDNPASIRKLFLFRELWSRSADTATAAIGAFDILESIKAPHATAHLQDIALDRAISSFGSLPQNEQFELFSMLLIRMSRVPTRNIEREKSLEGLLDVAVGGVLFESPEAVLSRVEALWPKLQDHNTFRTAFIAKLGKALPENPSLATAIAGHSEVGKELLIGHPEAFAMALNAPQMQLLRDQTLRWLSESNFRQRLHGVRAHLLRKLQVDEDLSLFKKILAGLEAEEVNSVLSALFAKGQHTVSGNHRTLEVVMDSISRPFPTLTREWIESSDIRDVVLAEVLSATYQPDPEEYRTILSRNEQVLGLTPLVLAQWIVRNSTHDPQFVKGISDCASHDRTILGALIKSEHSQEVDKALEILIDSLSSFPIDGELAEKAFLYQPFNFKLVDFIIRTAIESYLRSGESSDALEKVFEQKEFIRWLSSAKTWRLAELIRGGISSLDSCARGWEVLCRLPHTAYTRDTIVGTIESLLSLTAQYYSPTITEKWLTIISRARNLSSDQTFEIDLCGQAVRFAFDNPRLPVSGLVVETFSPLYKFVTEVKRVPGTAVPLFSLWNWDKGSELRESLVEKFLLGRWPAGDLALAVRDFALLRKILKRMSRKRAGQSLAREMYSGLMSRTDNQSRSLADALSGLLKNSDYDEDWD